MQLQPGASRGFEIVLATRTKLILNWSEKIVTERRIDEGLFTGTSYEEVRFIAFSLMFTPTSNDLILIDPPLGKHKVHSVLRELFGFENFLFRPINVRSSLGILRKGRKGVVMGIETDPVAVEPKICYSMIVSGYGNLLKYIADTHPQRSCNLRAAHLELTVPSGPTLRVTLSASGLVRFSAEVAYGDIEDIASELIE